ncbi:MAG: glycosyltransferase [Candidatus Kerfeldbacteria bacterium]|nr:glycosyltransferase [Candidatus Kerfeldbacteria bacterium]
MKLALVHEHLAQDGGAEKVLQAFQELYPDAPTYTLVHNHDRANPSFLHKDIRTSFIQKMPYGVKKYQWYLPLMPLAVERFDLMDYDVVLSSASAFAKGVITRPDAVHICYCHSPTRYLWSDTHQYIDALPYNRMIKRAILMLFPYLRQWDRLAADRVDHFIANSKTVQNRIRKYYHRDSTIIYPPVDVDAFSVSDDVEKYFLTGGRLVAYKRYDLTIQAFNRLGLPLLVFGAGPEEKRLRAMAKNTITFLGRVDDRRLRRLMSRAMAFIHPQEEDFGITPVESMAAGRPVIAYGKGGALETVRPGVTGVFFEEQSWEALADAVLRFRHADFNPVVIQARAAEFGRPQFAARIRHFLARQTNRQVP